MKDQAYKLRQMMSKTDKSMARIITITSGKGGVGKTSITINLAIALANMGYRVAIIDADFGFSNVDIMLGLSTKYNLSHVVFGNKEIDEVISKGPSGVMFISGGTGVRELLDLDDYHINIFINKISKLDSLADIVLIDTGAGLSHSTLKMVLAANEIILVTTPEPTSITDAYSIVKLVSSIDATKKFGLISNRAETSREGKQVLDKFSDAANRFLNIEIKKLGYIEYNSLAVKAVKHQVPFVLSSPDSKISRQIIAIAEGILLKGEGGYKSQHIGMFSYINNLLRLFGSRNK
ncbi:MinD/ParA family protein [Xylanivirga thermophila]|uniref:MinD/ParA family protein n=1 Tax=Xylanivirga thermophila TaxID=2496273 RepID=UPI00101BE90B|nr:MinD/ParA family protein [Xylanivirga thermophila]